MPPDSKSPESVGRGSESPGDNASSSTKTMKTPSYEAGVIEPQKCDPPTSPSASPPVRLIVLNERPPLRAGTLIRHLKMELGRRHPHLTFHAFDYEDMMSNLTIATRYVSAHQHRERVGHYEDTILPLLQAAIEAGNVVLLAGWVREGPAGKRLLSRFLSISSNTGCGVVWINCVDQPSASLDPGEESVAMMEDLRWVEQDVGIRASLDLLNPIQYPEGSGVHFMRLLLDEVNGMAAGQLMILLNDHI